MKLPFHPWSNSFSKLGFKRFARASRPRDTNFMLALESLEDRVMLTASIGDLDFNKDYELYGMAWGSIEGTVSTSGGASFGNQIEFDFDGNGSPDHTAHVDSTGAFGYSTAFSFGDHSIAARVLSYSMMGPPTPGPWQTLTFKVQAPIETPPEVSSLSFDWFSAYHGSAFGSYVGALKDNSTSYNYEIQLDLDGVTSRDGQRNAELTGTAQTPMQFNIAGGQLTEGEHKVWARALEFDNSTGQNVAGQWKEFTIAVDIHAPQIMELTYRQNSSEYAGHFSGEVLGFSSYNVQIDIAADDWADYSMGFGSSQFELSGHLDFGEVDVLARAAGYDSHGRYIEDEWQAFKFNLQQPILPVSSANNVYSGGASTYTQYDMEGTTTTTEQSSWNLAMTSQAISAGIWRYAGSTSATYSSNQDFQSNPSYADMYGDASHVSKHVTWSMDTWGNSLTSISGIGSDLSYTLTTQETVTDHTSGTYHLDQSDGIVYDASLSGLDTYSISRFGTTTISPAAGVTTISYTEQGNSNSLWQFGGNGSYTHEINEGDAAAGNNKQVSQDNWWTDESESSWSDVYTEIATVVIAADGSETKTGNRLENVNSSETNGTTWGGTFSYAETFIGEVPLVDPSADQSTEQSSDGTPPVPPPNPIDVPDNPDIIQIAPPSLSPRFPIASNGKVRNRRPITTAMAT